MKESELERKVVSHCHQLGLLSYKFTSPSSRGVPDRIVIGRGRVLFLELKRPGNRPTPLQEREIRRINEHGGRFVSAGWADSYADCVKLLSEFFT